MTSREGEIPNYAHHIWNLAGAGPDNFRHQISISGSQTLCLSPRRKYFVLVLLGVVGVAVVDLL